METVIPRNNIKAIKRFQFSRCEIIHFHLSSSILIFTFNFHFQGITFCCCTNDNETWPKNPPTRPIFELLYNRFYGISAQTSSVPPTAKPWRVDGSVVVEKKKKCQPHRRSQRSIAESRINTWLSSVKKSASYSWEAFCRAWNKEGSGEKLAKRVAPGFRRTGGTEIKRW